MSDRYVADPYDGNAVIQTTGTTNLPMAMMSDGRTLLQRDVLDYMRITPGVSVVKWMEQVTTENISRRLTQ